MWQAAVRYHKVASCHMRLENFRHSQHTATNVLNVCWRSWGWHTSGEFVRDAQGLVHRTHQSPTAPHWVPYCKPLQYLRHQGYTSYLLILTKAKHTLRYKKLTIKANTGVAQWPGNSCWSWKYSGHTEEQNPNFFTEVQCTIGLVGNNSSLGGNRAKRMQKRKGTAKHTD